MLLQIISFLCAIFLAIVVGKIVSKVKLPSILGWLIAGMILGPHALSLVNNQLLDAGWYQTLIHILECAVGLMIGTELVWKKIKKFGKSIIITTLTQSIGTFLLVSLVFGIVFYFLEIPIYLALIFGGIALATAPAPALSIVREFKTEGPVTSTLIPMAALDDIVGCVIFFSVITFISSKLSSGGLSLFMIISIIILPLLIGAVTGFLTGLILKKEKDSKYNLFILISGIIMASLVGFLFNNLILEKPVLNFMLIGMAFSAAFANMLTEKQLDQLMNSFNPILSIAMVIVILNLGTPLDYHLILGSGVFTVIYIVARALGKYFGAYFGASITKSPKTVKKYLGFTLLPHSGVSLVFTGIAVSMLSNSAMDEANIIQGTIAAAAVINEVIAVIMAKKGFEWAGEFSSTSDVVNNIDNKNIIITISRQSGSGGREIGRQLAKKLNIPFYDHEIIELATKSKQFDKSYFEECEDDGLKRIFNELATNVSNDLSLADKAFLHQSKIIKDLAKKGNCIIVGRCADYVLKGQYPLLKVFIYADKKERQHRIVHIYHEKEEIAIKEISATDKRRIAYYNHYTNQQFGDNLNYDICLNSSSVGIDECVKLIEKTYKDYVKKQNKQANK